MNKNRHTLNKKKKKKKSRKSFYPWIIRSSTGRQRYLAVKKEAAESRVRGRVSWIRMNLGQRFNFHRGPSPHDIFLQFLFAIRRHVQSNYSRKIFEFPSDTPSAQIQGGREGWKLERNWCNSIGTGATISIEEAAGLQCNFICTRDFWMGKHVTSLFLHDKTCSRNSSPLLTDDLSVQSIRAGKRIFHGYVFFVHQLIQTRFFFFKLISS